MDLCDFDIDEFPVVWREQRLDYTAEVLYDQHSDAGDPRDMTNVGHIVHWHRRYDIASDAERVSDDFDGITAIRTWLARERGAICVLPVGMIDHSGVSFYVGHSNHMADPGGWDSGQVGFIYATRATCDIVGIDPDDDEAIEAALRGEIELLDAYAQGNVFLFAIFDPSGHCVESCGGYLAVGDDGLDELRREAHDALHSFADTEQVERDAAARMDVATVTS